ncbi:MAG: carbohydrate binding domain-containing protein [Bacteroidales bacterium]
MKNTTSKWSIAALIVILFMAAGCERNLDDLELATYPTTPEVFIDGFSAGLYYAAYGTSNVTAFSVDNDVKYKGTASMKFAVPDTSDPNGSYAGGVFGADPVRDLSGYNVLTFWAKSSQAAVINEVGFGNDMGASKYMVTLRNITVNSNWKQYYIPIPDPSLLTQERGMFFYGASPQNGNGFTFWIDELKFEKLGTIAHASYGIYNGQDVIKNEVEVGDEFYVQDLYASFNLPTGIDQKVNLTPSYFTFISSNPAVATVNETGFIQVLDSGTAVITAKVMNMDAEGSLTIYSTGTVVAPVGPAPTPTISSSNVISLYSNAYTNVPVDTWNTHWLNSTTLNEFIQIQGDDVIRYRLLNFVGIEFTSNLIDASAMTHFTLDIWTPNPTTGKTFKVKLVDFGPDGAYGGGDDSDAEVTISSPPLASETWVTLNIPLLNFSGLSSKVHLAQLVLSGDIPDVYVDNVYFYNNGTTPTQPTTPAPTPTYSPANVISVFSDSYTNIAGTNLNPNWGQATVVTQVPILGNNTLKYAGLNYQGIQLGSNQNVTSMAFLHLDFWSANSSSLKVFLISPGPVEKAYTLTVPTSGWTSLDIPLSAFSPVDLTNIFQLKFEGNGDIFLDNILFHN